MSEYLTNFYCAYAEWLVFGAPQGQPFDRGAGLCYNLCKYMSWVTSDRELRIAVQDEMRAQFRREGLHADYPFSIDGPPCVFGERMSIYETECDREECHLNKRRIAWIRLHAMA